MACSVGPLRRSAPFGARSDPSISSVPALIRRLAPPPLLICAEPTTTPDSNQQVDQSGHDTPLKQGQSLVSGICGSVYVGAPACAMCAAGLESTSPGGAGSPAATHCSLRVCTTSMPSIACQSGSAPGLSSTLPPRLLSRDRPLAVASEGDEAKAPPTTTLTRADNRLTELGLTSTTIRRLRPYWQ